MPTNKHVLRLDLIRCREKSRDVQDVLAISPVDEAVQKKNQEKSSVADSGIPERCVNSAKRQVVSTPPNAAHDVDSTLSGRENKFSPVVSIDMFSPIPYEIGTRDSRGVMDISLYRLSKGKTCANLVIRYDLPDGYVEVTSGAYGMATIWDYDIILMVLSHLNEAMNQYRAGKGEKPGKTFRPHISDVLSFFKKSKGGNQRSNLIDALGRLSTTHIRMQRTSKSGHQLKTHTGGEDLISFFNVVHDSQTNAIEYIEIGIANWMYNEIIKLLKPDVLTVHPDYFKISQGVGRFVYRLARRTAGKDMTVWGFKTLYEHSGSTGSYKEFSRLLRQVITTKCVPEYHLALEEGKMGSMLRIVHHSQAHKWKIA